MPKPDAPIRRFDVFAEITRQQAMKKGMPADQARGYGLWLAKVVASRRYGTGVKPDSEKRKNKDEKVHRGKWRKLSGKPQTDKLFDREIVNRMGHAFYTKAFAPAIRRAIAKNESYVEIRDSIRKQWEI